MLWITQLVYEVTMNSFLLFIQQQQHDGYVWNQLWWLICITRVCSFSFEYRMRKETDWPLLRAKCHKSCRLRWNCSLQRRHSLLWSWFQQDNKILRGWLDIENAEKLFTL
jgi:hypothetical protein